jgi:hypothetical protein
MKMIVHSVYFWLNPAVSAEEKRAMVLGLESLRGIETCGDVMIGAPLPKSGGIADDSYDYALVIEFADKDALDAYNAHPVHTAFVEQFGPMFAQVKVYDCE